jgi:hypothetical protein
MLRVHGWTFQTDFDGKVIEHETFTCRHCNRVTQIPHKARPEDIGGFCTVCTGLICPQCVGLGCSPLEKKLEDAYRISQYAV